MTTASACPHPAGRAALGDQDTTVRTRESDGRGDVFRWTRAPLLTGRRGPDRRLPGPRGLPVVGVVPQYMRDPFSYVREGARKYGDIFRVPMPLWDLVVITHPDLVVEVF
ncbi:cytochrome P450, partial [Nocardia sp. NPDC051030]|uniref:cytochrome P450 n=1 Tax=Nocardia sp. NPDC051030 TaxID=3155162 RepID=UPI00341E9D8F